MTRTLHELQVLVNAIEKLSTLPISEIKQNKNLVSDITETLNARGLGRLVDTIQADYHNERMQKLRARPYKLDDNFLHVFARYKAAAFDKLKVGAKHYETQLIDASAAGAFNGEFESGKAKADIEALKETADFATAFNSIYASGALEINTPLDPTRLRSYIDYSPYLYNYAYYLGIPTLDKMVERPINLAMKKPPELKFYNQGPEKILKKVFESDSIDDVLRDMLFYSALSPRGSLLVPVIQKGRVRFNVFNDTQFTYGMTNAMGSLTARYSKTKVGDIYCLGATLKHGVSCFFNCPGFEPLYAVGKNRIIQLKEGAEALNVYIYIIKVLLVRAQVLIQKADGEGQTDSLLEQMKAQLSRLSATMGVSTPVVQPEGNELDILPSNITPGTSDIAASLKDFIGILSGISPDYFFGSDNAYQANSFNINVTNESIFSEIQKPQLLPATRYIVNTYLEFDERLAQWKDEQDKFETVYPSIYEETEKERADLAEVKIRNLTTMRDYPELEEAFKAEKLLPEKITFKNIPAPSDTTEKGTGDGTPPGDVADTDESLKTPDTRPVKPAT